MKIAAAILLVLCLPRPAHAQSQDDFFDDATLGDLQLTISQRDWDELRARADENTYYTADLRWNGITVRNIGIRSRGAGTRNGVKPGLRLDFNRYLADQQFLGLRALVLDNGWTDPSTMREILSMKLFARSGFESPREAHIRLFINNTYAGLYVAIEPVDRTFVTRVFGAAEGHVESGGYLYEYKWLREWHFEDLGDALAPYAAMFEPKTRETDAASRLYAPIAEMVNLANTVAAERLESELGARIDLPQVVRLLAIQAVVGEIDGLTGNWGMSNFYLYRFQGTSVSTLVPWDKSEAFKGGVSAGIWHNVDDVPAAGRNALMSRAMQQPSLRGIYLDTLLWCAAIADESGWLEAEVRRAAAQIREAVRLEPAAPYSFDEFEAEVERLLDFARNRGAIVREDVRRSPR